jgi:hypothetical protein
MSLLDENSYQFRPGHSGHPIVTQHHGNTVSLPLKGFLSFKGTFGNDQVQIIVGQPAPQLTTQCRNHFRFVIHDQKLVSIHALMTHQLLRVLPGGME